MRKKDGGVGGVGGENGTPGEHNGGLRQWRYGGSKKKRLKSAKLCKQLRRKDGRFRLFSAWALLILDSRSRVLCRAVITHTSNLYPPRLFLFVFFKQTPVFLFFLITYRAHAVVVNGKE